MIGFQSIAETLSLGAPVVRLFRVGLGRDPSPQELGEYAELFRRGAGLEQAAHRLVGTDAFGHLHGSAEAADGDFLNRLRDRLPPGLLPSVTELTRLPASRAWVLAQLASSPEAVSGIPLLPGLAPGAPPDDPTAYRMWVELYDSRPRSAPPEAPQTPCFTVVVPVADRQVDAALATAASLQAQWHGAWALVLASTILSPWPRGRLERFAREEARVRLVIGARGASAAEVLVRAADCAGPFAIVSPGDRLAPNALHEVAAAWRAHPDALLVFTDEDRLDGAQRTAPRFKPACSPDALLAGDLVGQLAVFAEAVPASVGGVRAAAWPHHVHELACRVAQAHGPARIRHVPVVLFHRAGAWVDPPARPASPQPVLAEAPLVSVIVPTRDRADLLACCADGVLARTDYPAIELLIVDNGSEEAGALDLLASLAEDKRVRLLREPGAFNFAALNNRAARAAKGAILLLLNNDVDVLDPRWLRHMVAHAMRPDVGAVGAKLLYPDGTVQHAGLLLGPDGAATHVGRGAAADDPGYLGQLASTRDLSAVTGACLATRASVWAQVDGMDERLAVTWNDVDFCLRVRAAGLRVLWTPDAVLRHAEGRTRGMDAADPARVARFRAEQALVRTIWGDALDRDPYLNGNLLALDDGRLCLTRPREFRPTFDADMPKS